MIFAAVLAVCAQTSAVKACAVALVLAIDVSRSVDPGEYRFIQHGTAEAFRNAEIVELLSWLDGGAYVSVVQWSGPDQQRRIIPWRHVLEPDTVAALAKEIDTMVRHYRYGLTSPGEALIFSERQFSELPVACKRRVIDISGDGIRNIGLVVGPVADVIEAKGVIINGLVVRGDTPDPLEFYQTEVKRGPLGFVQISKGFDDFPRAMFLKLLRELSPTLSELRL